MDDGRFRRVDHFIQYFRKHKPTKTCIFTDKAECLVMDLSVSIFSSPMPREQYEYLSQMGMSMRTYTPDFFRQQCERYGVEIEE